MGRYDGRMPPKIVLIVPCFNEESRLPLQEFRKFAERELDCSFLFVNDGSNDGTEQMLAAVCDGSNEQFSYITCNTNLGKGGAVQRGFSSALERSPRYIGYWDSDLSAPLTELSRMAELLDAQDGSLLVMGTRERSANADIRRTKWRAFVGHSFRWFRNRLLGMRLTDTQCGAKLMRNCPEVCSAFATPFSTRWLFDIEILMRLKMSDIGQRQVVTMPLKQWADSGGSRVTFREMVRIVFELVTLAQIRHDRISTRVETLGSES